MNIAQNLKTRREAYGLTQTDLAKRADVTQGLIAHIEQGTKIPSLAVSVSLAKALHCTVDDLIKITT